MYLRPFLSGIVVAFSSITISILSGVYWVCKDVSMAPAVECPVILPEEEAKKETKKRRNPFQFLNRKKKPKDVEMKVELVAPDPVDCACQLFWNFWKPQSEREVPTPITCTPKEKENKSRRPSEELLERFKVAYTPEKIVLSSTQKNLITSLAERTRNLIPEWDERTSKVKWGGDTWNWFDPKHEVSPDVTDIEQIDGGSLFYAYLRIMKWPESLYSHFPFKLCADGCDSEVAIGHTLEFREKFKPWMISPAGKKENANGCIFFKGFSISRDETENASHSVIWVRPGLRNKSSDDGYLRAHVNTLERAVAASLAKSNGRVGKFNVIVDCAGFSFGLLPGPSQIQIFVTLLQDHFPDRVGIILLSNMGRVTEMVLNMFMKLITEEVRNKIIILSRDPTEREKVLNAVVGYENIPKWLGGTDEYVFNSDDYYSDEKFLFSDEEAIAYHESMPYHT